MLTANRWKKEQCARTLPSSATATTSSASFTSPAKPSLENAVTFLARHRTIDADQLAAVGVCAGGGYAPAAAVADRRIKVVATASGLTDVRATIKDVGDWRSAMAAAGHAREEYARSGRPTYIPFLADGELDLWRENAKKFYLTDRNKDPNWRNETLLWSYDTMIQFSAIDAADLLTPTPLLLIAGSKAETLDHSERLYQRAQNVKELHVIDGGTHFDCYDIPQSSTPRSQRSTSSSRNISEGERSAFARELEAVPSNTCPAACDTARI